MSDLRHISAMPYFSSDLNVLKTKPAKMSQILPEMINFYEKRLHKIFKIGKAKLLSLRIITSSHLQYFMKNRFDFKCNWFQIKTV